MTKTLSILFYMLLSTMQISAILPHNVVICGICRDVEQRLPYSIQIMEEIGSLFNDYRIVVYENNSTDNTCSILQKWVNTNQRVFVKSEILQEKDLANIIINRKKNQHFFRPEEIARARNIVLEKAMSDDYQNFQYIIWMDMDFKIKPSFEGIIETFQSKTEWDAVFANGVDPQGKFWDWYAFRDEDSPIGSELLGDDWWFLPKSVPFNCTSDWYPVYSAFGGCGIYKKSSLVGCRYSGIVTKDIAKFSKDIINKKNNHPHILKYKSSIKDLNYFVKIDAAKPNLPLIDQPLVGIILLNLSDKLIWRMNSEAFQYPSLCEHVPLHISMIINGHGKLYINPRMIFHYSS